MKPADVKIKCTCGSRFKIVESFNRYSGPQWDRYPVESYTLYECPECTERYWDKEKV